MIETKDLTIKKSTIESYKIRHKTGMYWADINIDSNGNSGRIQIASDFGDWQYYWGSCGSIFKEFLCGLDKDYVANKFRANNHFDYKQTLKSIEGEIISQRREYYLTSEEARECWDDLEELRSETSREAFTVIIFNSKPILKLYDCGPDFHTTYDPGFNQFWTYIWPFFIDELKEEIKKIETEL